jgi:hypothetical protein
MADNAAPLPTACNPSAAVLRALISSRPSSLFSVFLNLFQSCLAVTPYF